MTAPDNAPRPEGYYWVRLHEQMQWHVFGWEHGCFWRPGSEGPFPESWVAEIGPRVYPPGEGVEVDLLGTLKNLAVEMRYMLRANPRKDGGLYRQRLTEAEAAIARAEGGAAS